MTILALLLLLAIRSSRYGLFPYLLKIVQMLRDYYHIAKCAPYPFYAYAEQMEEYAPVSRSKHFCVSHVLY